uniref:Putative ovule protein n=1 Tax=Solanum chacoense TaxID=4108 RepID=A0A0V0HIH6_SOLCH
MVGENKGKSVGANVAPGLLAENGRTVKKLKGHLVEDEDGDTNLDGSSDVVSRTYKRRKRTEVVEDGLVVGHSAGQSTNKV